jgi:hypothetical protein
MTLDPDQTADPDQVGELVERVRPLLAGQDPPVVGAALADLLAIWVAGHIVTDDPKATDMLRAVLLANHFRAVSGLVPINASILHGDAEGKPS